MNIKEKTVSGLFWSFTDSFTSQGIQFIVGIVLARILTPREFGLIGMLTIFIAISQSFIDSGFSNALIRKTDCTSEDYSTVFYYNIFVSILFYILLLAFAGKISDFFKEPQLKNLIKVLGCGLLFNSLAIIQRTILIKELNFKLQMKISIIASTASGILAIFMAFFDYGVWSLIALTLGRFAFTSLFLWIWSEWRPLLLFSRKSFRELFSYGSKILISGLIDTIYRNIYYLIIGKFFSASELGFYTRADQFQALPSQNLNGVISKVSFPVLSNIQNDKNQLKLAYKKIIKSTMLVTFVLMIGLAAVAKPLILTLIGEKWLPSVIYLQMLCFVGMFYPLHALNLNMMQVQGRSDLFLRLEIIKKTLAIPTIFIGIIWGIKVMIIGMLVNTIIAYFLNSYWSGKLIGYSSMQQIRDIVPSLLLALVVNSIVFILGHIVNFSEAVILVIQILSGAFIAILISEILHFKDYLYIRNTLFDKLFNRK